VAATLDLNAEEGVQVMTKPHYKVLPGEGPTWRIYDNWKDAIVKNVSTRKEARRIVKGLNDGWIKEEELT